MRIAVIGFGSAGRALSALMAAAGHEITVALTPGHGPDRIPYPALPLADAVRAADAVLLALPFGAVREVLTGQTLAGKVIIDVTNPVNPDWSPKLLGEDNSAAAEIARAFPDARVVKAFNTVFADTMHPEHMDRSGRAITVFAASDDADARARVLELATDCGFAPLDAGPLTSARLLEAVAHLNIALLAQGSSTHSAFLYDQVRT
ncbi:NADPH-dependent F420 reductase [Streptomyces sp. NPDC055722]